MPAPAAILALTAEAPSPLERFLLLMARETAHEMAHEMARDAARAIANLVDLSTLRTYRGGLGLNATAVSAILPARHRQARPTVHAASNTTTLQNSSDEDLLVLHRAGDARALRVLIERYSGELHGFLTRLVGSHAGADDVFQEAFLQVHLSADAFDAERRFKPWLYTIAANKGRDFLRRQKRRSAVSLDAPLGAHAEVSLMDLLPGTSNSPSSSLESGDEGAVVKQVIDHMPLVLSEAQLRADFRQPRHPTRNGEEPPARSGSIVRPKLETGLYAPRNQHSIHEVRF